MSRRRKRTKKTLARKKKKNNCSNKQIDCIEYSIDEKKTK